MPSSEKPARATFTLDEFCHFAGIGRTRTYEEINSGRLKAFKIGRRTLIKRVDAEGWLDHLAPWSC